jgi:hypothetical protein
VSLVLLFAALLTACLCPPVSFAQTTITYLQGNYAVPQSAQKTVTVAFTKAQTAGDLNVIVVGWNDSSATVSSVTDASGNSYSLAVGPTVVSGYLSQSIYYAANIAAAGANSVTVAFSKAAAYPDIRILEYSGANTSNPVDVTAAATGSNKTSTSATATTTNATDLIFGANIVETSTTGPGSGFTKRLLTSPDGDIAEDKMVTAAGSYDATATLSSSGAWIMQMVAFRTSGTEAPTAPGSLTATASSTSQVNLSWTASTSSLGVANYIVERCEGSDCTNFAQIATPTGTTYSDTGLTANTSYSYEVQAEDIEGNLSVFSNVATATTPAAATSTITYVQGNYATPQASETKVTVPFASAQSTGDLNVIVVGWNDSTATVSSVADTSGNVYSLAVGPTLVTGYLSQSIYYARNIAAAAAGANSVMVTFSTAAAYPDIRIVEYSGADPSNPVDVKGAATGSSTTSTSAAATTTNATDLIFGANIVTSVTSGPGSGFTKRLLTSPDGDIAEDKMTTAVGSYSATAPLSSGKWIMQMVAFRTPTSGSSVDPGVLAATPTSVSFGSAAVGSTSSQSVVLSNTGSASVTVSAATVTGAGFSASGLSFPLTLAAGQSASLAVTFAPTGAGSVSGSVSIVSNASDSTLAVPLSGTGATQTLSVSPSTLSFGDVTVGTSSVLPVVVTNAGTSSITVSQAAIAGSGFSVSGPTLPLALASGQATSFSITFDPTTATGDVTGSLSVVSNASNSPTSVSLSAASVNQHSVTLTWTASTSTGVTGYNVFRATVSGGPYTQINTSEITGTTYTDATVEAGETYYYVATSVTSADDSGYSNQATAVVSFP